METTDWQILFNVAVAAFGFLGGWMLHVIFDSIHSLRHSDAEMSGKVESLQVLLAGSYVTNERMDKMADAIFRKLDRIESKLDGKADKA